MVEVGRSGVWVAAEVVGDGVEEVTRNVSEQPFEAGEHVVVDWEEEMTVCRPCMAACEDEVVVADMGIEGQVAACWGACWAGSAGHCTCSDVA